MAWRIQGLVVGSGIRRLALPGRKIRGPRLTFLAYVLRRYWRDEALDLASSLAYTSLLSTVPLLVIGLGLLAAFPGFESMRHELLSAVFREMVPEVGAQLQIYMGRFAANAGRLTAFGIVGLVATAVMLLVAIEAALNRIFRVPHLRAPWSRLIVYWAALTLGPLLAGVSLTLSAWLSVLPWVRSMHLWAGREATADLRDAVAAVSPFVIMTAAFAILFVIAPARRVRLGDALTGGVVAALLLLALRKGFALYIALWAAYRPVYGALATVPIFLAWVYLSWATVLFGAEIAAALPERRRGRLDHSETLPHRRQLAAALVALKMLAGAAARDGKGMKVDAIALAAGEGERPVAETLKRMAAAGLVTRTAANRFFAGGKLADARLADLLRALDLGVGPLRDGDSLPDLACIEAAIAAAARAEAAALQTPLVQLFKETTAEP